MIDRPDYITDAHIKFLDKLRMKGTVNMFMATPDVMKKFKTDKETAKNILVYWMKTFSVRMKQ